MLPDQRERVGDETGSFGAFEAMSGAPRQAAQAAGLLVAIDPVDKKPLYFKPSPDRPPPAKVVVPESAVPPEVLAAA